MGFRAFFGPIVGALSLTLLQDQLQSITQYWRFVLGAILAAIVIFFPRGLAGIATDIARLLARRKQRGRRVTPLLEAKGVSKHFGEFRALRRRVGRRRGGEFVSVVGPNGAGKTTLVNVLTGLLPPSEGQVFFKGENISGVGPIALAKRGMARTFQLVQIFPQLTVAETIAAAVVSQQRNSGSCCLRIPRYSTGPTRARNRRHLWYVRQVGKRLTHALARREETAGRGVRLCFEPRGHLARRANFGRFNFRETRADADPDRCRQGRRRQAVILIEHEWTWWPHTRSA